MAASFTFRRPVTPAYRRAQRKPQPDPPDFEKILVENLEEANETRRVWEQAAKDKREGR